MIFSGLTPRSIRILFTFSARSRERFRLIWGRLIHPCVLPRGFDFSCTSPRYRRLGQHFSFPPHERGRACIKIQVSYEINEKSVIGAVDVNHRGQLLLLMPDFLVVSDRPDRRLSGDLNLNRGWRSGGRRQHLGLRRRWCRGPLPVDHLFFRPIIRKAKNEADTGNIHGARAQDFDNGCIDTVQVKRSRVPAKMVEVSVPNIASCQIR